MDCERKRRCCIKTCKGERFSLSHKFPKLLKSANAWLDAIDDPDLRKQPKQKLSNYFQVCSRHFRITDYKHPESRGLNKTAIPSLNLKDLSQLHLARDSTPPEGNCLLIQQIENGMESNEPTKKKKLKEDINLNKFENYDVATDEANRKDHQIPESHLTFLEIGHPDYENKLSLNSFWLRCHCQCSSCYDLTIRRRKISPIDVAKNVGPITIEQNDALDTLLIKWSDDHYSKYDVHGLFISQNNAEPNQSLQKPWPNKCNDVSNLEIIQFAMLITCEEKVVQMFKNLFQHGVSVIKSIPLQNNSMAKMALCRLFPNLENIYFDKFNEIHTNICTNITYSNADCGLKCFFVTKKVQITLADGLKVGQDLKTVNASAFEMLTKFSVPFEIMENGVQWKTIAPIIELDPVTGRIKRTLLDVNHLGLFNTIPQNKVEQFIESIKELIHLINAKSKQLVIDLEPGTMIILDNWRIFHKFSNSDSLLQSYLGRKDFESRLRFLGLIQSL